jgi:hypothetical protein
MIPTGLPFIGFCRASTRRQNPIRPVREIELMMSARRGRASARECQFPVPKERFKINLSHQEREEAP